jgi:hypothetical protein
MCNFAHNDFERMKNLLKMSSVEDGLVARGGKIIKIKTNKIKIK